MGFAIIELVVGPAGDFTERRSVGGFSTYRKAKDEIENVYIRGGEDSGYDAREKYWWVLTPRNDVLRYVIEPRDL